MKKNDYMIIVGRHAVVETLKMSPYYIIELILERSEYYSATLKNIIQNARLAGIKINLVKGGYLDLLSKGAVHQGVALRVISKKYYVNLDKIIKAVKVAGEKALVVLADHIQDQQNLGALIRSAAAVGAQGLVIPRNRACSLTPVVTKVAAGGVEYLPVSIVNNLVEVVIKFKEIGLVILGAVTHNAVSPWELELKRPLVLVVGSEHKGISQRLLKFCDLYVSLPMFSGVESLNVSVAAGVILFEVIRQRG